MEGVTITVPDLQGFVDDIAKAGGDAAALVEAAYMNGAARIQSTVRQLAPHDTGTLQRSVQIEKEPAGVAVKVNEEYGQYLEYGTGLYGPLGRRITPKSARVLAWTSKGGGKVVFARSTAGMRKQPFFWRGVEESTPYVFEQFNLAADKLVMELKG